ncbi:MAG: TonB-dependent receptor [Crocinitomicaceae bacterium]|nr:TonB-dependent receptor [Crocinitomicaceae bacterium]|tara:strand:- start:989 stop:3400 length:2412 start_codon:yes stop_codon:yes gene_type:complete
MTVRFILMFAILGMNLCLTGQRIHIYNIDNLKPIPEVFIVDHHFKNSIKADKNGIADLSAFGKDDTLIFQHPSYNRLLTTYKSVIASNKTVYLTESAIDLKSVTVTANKRKQLETEVPNMIVPISVKDIEFSNSQTSADILNNTGEVFVQKSQLGGGSPMIRGFSANRILIVVDGIRMNNAIFRSGNLQNIISIDPNSVSAAEVIYGPGSVIYGSDALGGVMSFATAKPKLSFKKDSMQVGGDALLRYSSANTERTGHLKLGVGWEKLGFLFSYTFSAFNDLQSGAVYHPDYQEFGKRNWFQIRVDGKDTVKKNFDPQLQIASGYSQQNFMFKTLYQPTDKVELNLGIHYSNTSNIPRYDRLVQEEDTLPRYGTWFYGPQEWFMANLSSNFDISNDAWDRIQIIGGYQYFNESRNDRKFNSNSLRKRNERVNVFTLNVEFDKYIGKKHTVYYGIEGVYNTVFSEASTFNIATAERGVTSTRYPNGGSYWANAAAYITYKWDINKKLNFSTGLRYTYIEMESKFTDTTFYKFPFDKIKLSTSAFNGSFIGLNYMPSKKWKIGFNTASGFRAPNIDDLAKVFDSEPGKVVVPNEDLSPEYSYNSELSISRELSYKGQVEIVSFYTYLVDAMVRRKATFNGQDSIIYDRVKSEVQMITNTGRAHIYGASLNLRANISKKFGVIQTFTWTDGEDLENKVPLRHVAPAFGKTSIFFKSDKLRTEIYSQYNAWKHWDDLAPEEQGKAYLYTKDGTPAWYTINVRGSYELNETIAISAAVENIVNYHYRPYSSGISAPGRNFLFALRAKF